MIAISNFKIKSRDFLFSVNTKLNSSLKIALISPEFPPFSLGGVSAVCRELAEHLSRLGISTTVFCGRSSRISCEKVNKYLRIVRLPLLNLPPRHFWFQVQNLSIMLDLLKEFDVIHSVDTRASAFLAYLKKHIKRPFITHVHGCGHCETKTFLNSPISCWSLGEFVYTVLEYPLNEYLTNLSLRNSDHIVVCSKNRLNEMKRRNPEIDCNKVSIIYNGIDFDKIPKGNASVEERKNSVLFWGRLYYNKGIIHLIKAMSMVKKNIPDVTLDLCGKGPLEAKIRSLVFKLNLEENVRIHGYVDDEVLSNKIKYASIIALPSLYEGQPIAALEAMAYKKPLIMYDFPFAREYLINWYNGLLADRGNIKDLADKIELCLTDKKLRLKLGKNAYEHVKKNHNWSILVQKYVELYNNIARRD